MGICCSCPKVGMSFPRSGDGSASLHVPASGVAGAGQQQEAGEAESLQR